MQVLVWATQTSKLWIPEVQIRSLYPENYLPYNKNTEFPLSVAQEEAEECNREERDSREPGSGQIRFNLVTTSSKQWKYFCNKDPSVLFCSTKHGLCNVFLKTAQECFIGHLDTDWSDLRNSVITCCLGVYQVNYRSMKHTSAWYLFYTWYWSITHIPEDTTKSFPLPSPCETVHSLRILYLSLQDSTLNKISMNEFIKDKICWTCVS